MKASNIILSVGLGAIGFMVMGASQNQSTPFLEFVGGGNAPPLVSRQEYGGDISKRYKDILNNGVTDQGRITQTFGRTSFAVQSGAYNNIGGIHNGIDLVFNDGVVTSISSGYVVDVVNRCTEGERSCNKGYGNSVLIESGSYKIFYSHFKDVNVSIGEKVEIDQEIGKMGNTGYSTGAHLHLSTLRDNTPVTPYELIYRKGQNDWTPYVEYAKDNPIPESIRWSIMQNLEGINRLGSKYGCHPAVMSAIHYRETSFGHTTAGNGQGPYQVLSNRLPTNQDVTDWDSFIKQSCEHLRGKVGGAELMDIEDMELIGTALARYNGCNSKDWINCPYTSSKLTDDYRFSESNPEMRKCNYDYCRNGIMTPDTRYGALAIIANMIAFKMEVE